MQILLTGLNHKTAPVEVRERVSFSKEQLSRALPLLAARTGEAVVLSTCNRTEVYTATDSPEDSALEIRSFLADFHGVAMGDVSPHLYDRAGREAVHHLFTVSAGLDSMILGESQILGQVRTAFALAAEHGAVASEVSRLFHRAIRTGRRVREETEISRNALSISYAAVQLAQKVMGRLAGKRVLLIGAGDAGQLVARALRTTGAADLMIANRTLSRAEELASELSGRAVPFADIPSALIDADIVIAATEAPEFVLRTSDLKAAFAHRNARPVFLFDLSVPLNIDPQTAKLDGVSLYDIDDLSAIAEENLQNRRNAADAAAKIVDEETDAFMSWWSTLDALPLVKSLRAQAEDTRARELARAVRKLGDLPPEQLEIIDALTRSITNRLLHDPTLALKQADEAELKAIRALLGMDEGH
ncbi:MAG: glutamyl-tRNA reductase [SAR202 cluster bacterium]|nr:glutamyl-tRNA reductase [SAR202 cluster bacterium]